MLNKIEKKTNESTKREKSAEHISRSFDSFIQEREKQDTQTNAGKEKDSLLFFFLFIQRRRRRGRCRLKFIQLLPHQNTGYNCCLNVVRFMCG